MTTNDSELQQRKIYEKIRLYTQYGINDPNNPSDDEKAKLKTHFETLLKQYTNDRKDHTSPTYSAFLEGESPSAPTATTDLIDTRVESNTIADSAVDLALPIVFFETGSASSKLENWSRFIGPKLKPKGADLWDHADDIDRSKKPTIFALKRIGIKWEPSKSNDLSYLREYAEKNGITNISEFANKFLAFADPTEIKNKFYLSKEGESVASLYEVAKSIRRINKQSLVDILDKIKELESREIKAINNLYAIKNPFTPKQIKFTIVENKPEDSD